MAKDKDRALNPAAAQRKLDKQKALKKGKATVAAQRTERLAHRNPERLQRQIDELKAVEGSGGKLAARDKKLLEELERDVGRVRKARETVGVPERGTRGAGREERGNGDARRRGERGGMLGKRRRVDNDGQDGGGGGGGSSSDTDESVRRIPMPRDTPPPIPFPHRHRQNGRGQNANLEPLGQGRGGGERDPHGLPPKPVVQAQTVYEAKPAVRDLRKEAVSRFVPSVVARKLEATKGLGKLLEEHEVERLEREGYGDRGGVKKGAGVGVGQGGSVAGLVVEAAPVIGATDANGGRGDDDGGGGGGVLAEEEERFSRELRGAEMEEVEDEDL